MVVGPVVAFASPPGLSLLPYPSIFFSITA